ncbi:ParB/RepB/Spo0J family partition protein [Qiania dongpingensis]|uniref:ParB/RepB/Spo0J family partition protein n=1 Tax=Qiania dongpingensis TaxID=2763669 RepID=A0A7G9G0Z6_9FIRM|nr:ParB/RepB/Spo0J family partition protein [Qiania dongpingensis]QNM04478.1 ParB/RepB/Spo0J family partition protein [Qiania dongpingensis]
MARAKRSGLGKGLDSLIPMGMELEDIQRPAQKKNVQMSAGSESAAPSDSENERPQTFLKISQIEPNREQPRKQFDEESLAELAESIKQYGVLQPLLVQKREDYYEIIAGERRWRAAKLAKVKEVPVIIKEYTPQEIMEISLIENIQREDLNPIEEASAYQRLIDEFHLKHEEIAVRVSKSRTAITNSMRLLKLDKRVQLMLVEGEISGGHARTLLSLEDKEIQYKVAERIIEHKLSVRETEKLVKSLLNPKNPKKTEEADSGQDFIYKNIESKIREILGTKVNINRKDANRGRIEIEYYSMEELERLMDLFGSMK